MTVITALQQLPENNPSNAQRRAADPRHSVWVSASAGSGKTKVLTERVMRLLLTGVRPEKILCLTFTRAGAAEMSNRITERLSAWAVSDDNQLHVEIADLQDAPPAPKQMTKARRLFAEVLACPGGLRIRTIHSFCQEILSRFPIEAGLQPHFALIDEQEQDRLYVETLDDLLRKAGDHPASPIAQALSVLMSAQSEKGITENLDEILCQRGRLRTAIEGAGGLDKLITLIRAFLRLEPDDTIARFCAEAMAAIPEAEMRELALWLAEGSKTHSDRARILADILALPASDRATHFRTYCGVFMTQKNEPRAQFGSKEILSKHPQIIPLSQCEAMRLQLVLERIEAVTIAEQTAASLTFGHEFTEKLAARKKARAALDYDDLILITENLLSRPGVSPWILYKLDNGIDHILVDEAQDTSRAQWNIVRHLTAEFHAGEGVTDKNRTLFVVGDEKQSIFSFQNADPEAFLSLRDFFAQSFANAGKKLEQIGLHTSFRSAPAILRAVDAIFVDYAVRQGVSVDPVTHSAWKNRDGSDKIGRVEIWPLLHRQKADANEEENWPMPIDYEETHDPQAELAQQIAHKIKGWLRTGEMLPGYDRPINGGDIMILLRRRGRFADLMVRALKAQNVPVTGVDRMHLITQLPVMDLLTVLRFVLLPEDDLNLASLLRSPLIGLQEEDLMRLAIGRTDSLWHSLRNHADYKIIHAYLSAKLGEADISTPFSFLSGLLNTPCPADDISGRRALWKRLGMESLDPIEELMNKAQSYGVSRPPSLQNFLHWLTRADSEIKRELDHGGSDKNPDAAQVRIMTVHASKGLEAPIVFLPDTAALPRTADLDALQWNTQETPLFLTRQPRAGDAAPIWQQARARQMQEYRRLFYVALTRAANRLYLCGWLTGNEKDANRESWYALARKALQPLHQPEYMLPEDTADIVFADPVLVVKPTTAKPRNTPVVTPLPEWATRPVPALPDRSKPPSRAEDAAATPDAAFTRGRIIHRLLQSLPDIAPEKRATAIIRFLSQPRHNLTAPQCDEITNEVNALLNDPTFAILFSTSGMAEVPLTGMLNGAPAFRQIDRLCLHKDEVWIVDYKTNRPPPTRIEDIPDTYRQQLAEYRVLLHDLYPTKQIRCFLLWTYAPRLMEIIF